jgi:hypothetical protein
MNAEEKKRKARRLKRAFWNLHKRGSKDGPTADIDYAAEINRLISRGKMKEAPH